MGLPKINYPIYSVKLSSLPNIIEFRPFVSREEKILLIAAMGKDPDEMSRALKQVATNCVVTPGFNADKLPSFDLEYLFVKIRSKSVGDTVTMTFLGREPEAAGDCDLCVKPREVKVKLDDIELAVNPEHTNTIKLSDDIIVVMKYPTAVQLNDLITVRTSFDVNLQYKIMADCIDYICDKETTNEISQHNRKEAVEWLETLYPTDFAKIVGFFDTMPTLQHVVNLDCPKCGHKENYTIEGLEGFFS